MSAYGKYAIVFGLLGGTLQSAWFLSSASGYVSQSNSERPPPLSARSASTGWRQYHFWHSGFSGGK
jgi:hypothetical protein